MFETMSIYSLVLMLGAALLFPPAFRQLLGAPRAVLLRASWNLWAITLPFAALCWYLAALWAQASRPLHVSLAALVILLVLFSLVFAFLPVKPRAGLDRHLLTLAILVAYATLCWTDKSLFASVTGATFDTQALMFGYLLLCPALTAALLPRPRPITTGMFIVLTALLLYAAGIWATSASWGIMPTPAASVQPTIAILGSLFMLAVLAWILWQARGTPVAEWFATCLLAAGQWLVAIARDIKRAIVNIVLDRVKELVLFARSLGRAGVWIVSVLIPGIGMAIARGSVILFQTLWRGITSIPALFWNMTVEIGNGIVNAVTWVVSVPILGVARWTISIGDALWRGLVGASRALFRASVWLVTFALPSILHGLAELVWRIGSSLFHIALAIAHGLVALAGGLIGLGRVLLGLLVATPRVLWRALNALVRGFARCLYAFVRGLLTLLIALASGALRAVVWFITVLVPGVGRALIELIKWMGAGFLRLLRIVGRESVALARGVWHACVWLVTVLIPSTDRAIRHSLLALGRGLVKVARASWHACVWLATVLVPNAARTLWHGLLALVQGLMRAVIWFITAALPAIGRGLVAAARKTGQVLLAVARGIRRDLCALGRGLALFLVALVRGSWRSVVWVITVLVPRLGRSLLAIVSQIMRGISDIVRGLARSSIAFARALVRLVTWLATVALPSMVSALLAIVPTAWHALVAATRGLVRMLTWLVAAIAQNLAFGLLAVGVACLALVVGLARVLHSALVWIITVLLPGIPRALWNGMRFIAEAIAGLAYGLLKGLAAIVGFAQSILILVRDMGTWLLRTLWHIPLNVYLASATTMVIVVGALIAEPFVTSALQDVSRTLWPPPPPTLRILAGSNFRSLEPILQRWGSENQVDVQATYRGSIDIEPLLEGGNVQYDAAWEGDSLWTAAANNEGLLKDTQSIMCSPVVLGVKKRIAGRLGWVDNRQVRLQDIYDAAESAQLHIFMSSPTKSNSGALAYFGFLQSFSGNPTRLAEADLELQETRHNATTLMRRMDRTGDSSGWLRDSCQHEYGRCEAMINYESLILEMNQEMVARGQEPMYVVYPAEGLGLADFPLSLVNKGNAEKEALFLQLESYLRSDPVQSEIAALGNRVGPSCDRVNAAVFRSEWGADLTRVAESMPHPDSPVISIARNLYQTSFRKPSFTVYLLDFSTSMQGSRRAYLQMAMRTVLDPREAAKYLLQGTSDDVTIVIPFAGLTLNDGDILNWTVAGSDPAEFDKLLNKIQQQPEADMTNIYMPVAQALSLMKEEDIGNYMPSIILMTDGESNRGSITDVQRALAESGLYNVPIYGITFGDASQQQLNELAGLTGGRVFDGTQDLIEAFRQAKGQN